MRKTTWLALTLALIGIGGIGCLQDTVNTVENADKTMSPNTITDRRFATDNYLRDRLKLIRADISETSTGLMRAQVAAMNTRTGFWDQFGTWFTNENPYRIKYMFTWMDQNGMVVNSIMSTWETRVIQPGETVYFQSVAPNKNCKDFVLNLQESD